MHDDIERRAFETREQAFDYCMRARGLKPGSAEYRRYRDLFENRGEADVEVSVDILARERRLLKVGK